MTRTSPRRGSVSTSPGRSRACGLSVGWRLIRTSPGCQSGAIGSRPHEPRAPQPLVQPLPVAILPVRHLLQRGQRRERAARHGTVRRCHGAAAQRASMAGAGGPKSPAPDPPRHNPEAKLAQNDGQQVGADRQPGPEVARQRDRAAAGAPGSSPATRSAMSSRNRIGPVSSQPIAAANPTAHRSRGGIDQRWHRERGTGTPCARAQSRARIAAVRGFSIPGTNSANRPERTPSFENGRKFRRVSSCRG